MSLVAHLTAVRARLERAAGPDFPGLPALELAVVLHEEGAETLSKAFGAVASTGDARAILAVVSGFGEVWKCETDADLHSYVTRHREHLADLLLFELAHEGSATAQMRRAAELAGIDATFRAWLARLDAFSASQ